jgi:hypothetical protein
MDCRQAKHREHKAEYQSRIRAFARDLESDTAIYRESWFGADIRVQDTTEWLMGAARDDDMPIQMDIMDAYGSDAPWPFVPAGNDVLPGATTNRGPDEGVSTTNPDLVPWLDQRAKLAANDLWFRENPHWTYALSDSNAF